MYELWRVGLKRYGHNPWVTRALQYESGYWGEYIDADELPAIPCEVCGNNAYFHPKYKGAACPSCNHIRIEGDWYPLSEIRESDEPHDDVVSRDEEED